MTDVSGVVDDPGYYRSVVRQTRAVGRWGNNLEQQRRIAKRYEKGDHKRRSVIVIDALVMWLAS
jgi:hypothetical protein